MTLNLQPLTAADIEGMLAAVSQWKPGDYIEPLVDWPNGERGRRALRVTERREVKGSVFYAAVDRLGVVFDVWRSDDPRASNEADFDSEEPFA